MVVYGPLVPEGYAPRLTDELVRRRMDAFGAVEICGTRWSGKSWTSMAFAKSLVRVDDRREILEADPSLALVGEKPVAIDEWQDVPAIWNRVRHAVDDSGSRPGQFILTGSSSLQVDKGRHSGAGRISRIRMRTMTLAELGISSKQVSLADLFEGKFQAAQSQMDLAGYAELICHGGWPALMGASVQVAREMIDEYLELLFNVSMRALGKNPRTAQRIATSLARTAGTSATLNTIRSDVAEERGALSTETIAAYLEDLQANFFFDELGGWDAPVRAKSRVRSKPKRYLDDPSMAAALLGVGPEALLMDGQLLGTLFENLVVHDLWVYASLLPGAGAHPLHYYADSDGLEVDVIIELTDGRWAAIEIKLGDSKVDQGVKNLLRLEKKVLNNPLARGREPVFKAVVVGSGAYARQLSDSGIYVIPLDTLTV